MEIKRKTLTLPLHSLVTLWLISLLAPGASGCGSAYDANAPGRDVPAYLKADMKAARRSIPPISELDSVALEKRETGQSIAQFKRVFGSVPYRQWTFAEPLRKRLHGRDFSFDQVLFYQWARIEQSPTGYLTKENIGLAVFLLEGNVQETFVTTLWIRIIHMGSCSGGPIPIVLTSHL